MEQLTQNLKSGEMKILEVPYPGLSQGMILVRNHFSLISAGTEGKTVKDARLSMLGKAMARKEEVKKVIAAAKTFGLKDTYRMVMNRLDAPSALGYSTAGEVIAVAEDVKEFAVGDLVACGGSGANHAEVIAVPINLCVKVPDRVLPEHACFTTLGAIAMQGVRQADLRLGENCVVIGLGLLGQLTMQILQASGIKTIGIDIDSRQVQFAKNNGLINCCERNSEGIESIILTMTSGYGADAVIITAATSSNDPVEFAGEISRKKGKVIIVGAVPTGFSRKNYYVKELELKMSCSYGPGRYDSNYEEGGIDYPYAYVRWTENRNMQSFIELVAEKKVTLEKLLTHSFDFRNAPAAYQMILDRTESFAGIVLKYNLEKSLSQKVVLKTSPGQSSGNSIGLIGAGSFGQNFLIPGLQGHAQFVGVCTARSNNARNIADKYGFQYCTGNSTEIISDKNISTVFIATRHNTHASFVKEALLAGKNVFVEKPLCMTWAEMDEIIAAYNQSGKQLLVGFNRRFAPFTVNMKDFQKNIEQKSINYRINAGVLPVDHWIHDPKIGGGRIIGEVCHFIDLCMFIAASPIQTVAANALKTATNTMDTLVINLAFVNGSVANISYFSNGNKNVSKEYLEVFAGGTVAIIDDFKSLTLHGKKSFSKKGNQDKGHREELAQFMQSVTEGKQSPISFDELILSTKATFKVIESISSGGQVMEL